MNTEMLAELAKVPPGQYCIEEKRSGYHFWRRSERGGWLTVEAVENNNTSIMWTTHKDHHWRYEGNGPAMCVTISPAGVLAAYLESAITMWIKWGYGRGGEEELSRALTFAEWAHSKLVRTAKEAECKST